MDIYGLCRHIYYLQYAGMDECKGADLNYGLLGGSATWRGAGSWTAVSSAPICIKFYETVVSPKPTCCCDLQQRTLATNQMSDLVNCSCHM